MKRFDTVAKTNKTMKETYLNHEIHFLDNSNKHDNKELFLEPGDYNFRFNLTLLSSLPTSFEHQYGRVRYSINATMGKF